MAAAQREAKAAGYLEVEASHLLMGLLQTDQQNHIFTFFSSSSRQSTLTSTETSRWAEDSIDKSITKLLQDHGLQRHFQILADADFHIGYGCSNFRSKLRAARVSSGNLPLSSRAMDVLIQARRAARMYESDVVDLRHVLWGLLQLPRNRQTNPLIRLVEDPSVKTPGALFAILSDQLKSVLICSHPDAGAANKVTPNILAPAYNEPSELVQQGC